MVEFPLIEGRKAFYPLFKHLVVSQKLINQWLVLLT
jgi:hypothetical protein